MSSTMKQATSCRLIWHPRHPRHPRHRPLKSLHDLMAVATIEQLLQFAPNVGGPWRQSTPTNLKWRCWPGKVQQQRMFRIIGYWEVPFKYRCLLAVPLLVSTRNCLVSMKWPSIHSSHEWCGQSRSNQSKQTVETDLLGFPNCLDRHRLLRSLCPDQRQLFQGLNPTPKLPLMVSKYTRRTIVANERTYSIYADYKTLNMTLVVCMRDHDVFDEGAINNATSNNLSLNLTSEASSLKSLRELMAMATTEQLLRFTPNVKEVLDECQLRQATDGDVGLETFDGKQCFARIFMHELWLLTVATIPTTTRVGTTISESDTVW